MNLFNGASLGPVIAIWLFGDLCGPKYVRTSVKNAMWN